MEQESLPQPQELVQTFDKALGRPPFVCSEEVVEAARNLRDGLSRKPLSVLKLAPAVVTDLPIIASSLALGFASSANGLLDAKPLVLTLCECLAHVASIVKFPLVDFLATTRKIFPTCREVVALHRSCGAIDMDILRVFLGNSVASANVPVPPPATISSKKKPAAAPAKKQGGPSVEKSPPGAASGPTAPSPPPEVIGELCLAPLNPDERKLLVKQFDSAAKFSAVIGTNAQLATVVLSIYGAQLVPLLKPGALIPCMGTGTAEYFVDLLDKHALSLAVLIDEDPQSNAFCASLTWCAPTTAISILHEIAHRQILTGFDTSAPFGFIVGLVLWMRAAVHHDGVPFPTVSSVASLFSVFLGAAAALASRREYFGPQRWIIPVRHGLRLLRSLLPNATQSLRDVSGIKDSLEMHGSMFMDLLLLLLTSVVFPSPAPVQTASMSKKSTSKTANKPNSSSTVSPSPPALDVMDSQEVIVALLSIAHSWAGVVEAESSLIKFVDVLIPWVEGTSARKELLESASELLLASCLTGYVYSHSKEGQSVVSAIIRAPCRDVHLIIAQICAYGEQSEGKNVIMRPLVHALLDAVIAAPSLNEGGEDLGHLSTGLKTVLAHCADADVAEFIVSYCQTLQQQAAPEILLQNIETLVAGNDVANAVIASVKGSLDALAHKKSEASHQREAERYAQARHAADVATKKREQQAKQLEVMRRQYASMMSRREQLARDAQNRMVEAEALREQRTTARNDQARENLEVLRASANQAKKNREAALRVSIAGYRDRIAQTCNVTTFLKSLGIPDARVYAVPRELHSKMVHLSPQEVLEYVVDGIASVPHDLPTSAQREEQREATCSMIFSDELTLQQAQSKSVSFWDLVMNELEAPVASSEPEEAKTEAEASTFHFRVAPLLDLFTFDVTSDGSVNEAEGTRLSLPIRLVKQQLEEPYDSGSRSTSRETAIFAYVGFEDALHLVYTAQQRGLVKLEKGMLALTPLGHAYHRDFWNRNRSLDSILAAKRNDAKSALLRADATASSDGCDDEDDFCDEDDVNWFADELI